MAHPQRRKLSIRRNEPRLWPFGAALAAGFAVAILGLTSLTWLAWLLLHRPSPPHPGTISLHDTVSVLQLVFASVAGSGALVALIVAYRKQKVAEADSAHDRARVFNERFATIATQLGDESAAVRLAAVHAMAGLADDWETNRQTCIDVLCAYLRMPYTPDPGEDASATEQHSFRSNREVRHTVIRIITAHLRDGAAVSWRGRNFDFTGVTFDGGDFSAARFADGTIDFNGAAFTGSTIDFSHAEFRDSTVNFLGAEFTNVVHFSQVKFVGGTANFLGAKFTGGTTSFSEARFTGSTVNFLGAKFTGGTVDFSGAEFTGGTLDYIGAKFTGSVVYFSDAGFITDTIGFTFAEFSGGTVDFRGAEFSSNTVDFSGTEFSGGTVDFGYAEFSDGTANFRATKFTGSVVRFLHAKFTGGAVDFSDVDDWSCPPRFDEPVPSLVKLPARPDPADSEG